MRTESSGVWGAALLVLLGLFQMVSAVQFDVQDEKNVTCILADLSVDFLVEYTALGKQANALFKLPENATLNNSTCGKENTTAPLLSIKFGAGHQLHINFSRSASRYQAAALVFVYSLLDKESFPNATENGTVEVSSNDTGISANTNSRYKCTNPHIFTMGKTNITFHNVTMEAYLNQSTYSKKETPCSEDIVPTSSPTTLPTTTVGPTSTPVVPKPPQVGEYHINGTSGYCILAKMGLQFNIHYIKKDGKSGQYLFNIEPANMTVKGSCINSTANMSLLSEAVSILFTFFLNTTANKFYLEKVDMNATLPVDAEASQFKATNNSLMYFQTSAHKSYKCNTMQTLNITSNFSINTFNLQIQPFDLEGNQFGPAVDCTADETGMLVPIIVGAALAGLVLIVLIAYLIGRKRSHAGYQTI